MTWKCLKERKPRAIRLASRSNLLLASIVGVIPNTPYRSSRSRYRLRA
jgi:hypothetical protein